MDIRLRFAEEAACCFFLEISFEQSFSFCFALKEHPKVLDSINLLRFPQ